MIIAVFNGFSVPLEVAFYPEGMQGPLFLVINTGIDLLFFMDIIINFRTTYINRKTGNEVVDTKTIALSYLKGRFWIDLLATLPYALIAEVIFDSETGGLVRYISLLKIMRILRINKIISILKVANEVKLSLKLMKLVFFLLMYLH